MMKKLKASKNYRSKSSEFVFLKKKSGKKLYFSRKEHLEITRDFMVTQRAVSRSQPKRTSEFYDIGNNSKILKLLHKTNSINLVEIEY